MEKYDTDAGAVIVNSKNEFLLLFKRSFKYWECPKGHMEGQEDELLTMDREVKEETGIRNYDLIKGYRFLDKYTYNKDGVIIHKTAIMYLIRTNDPVEITIEHEDYKWLNYEDALKLVKHKEQKQMITEAYKFL